MPLLWLPLGCCLLGAALAQLPGTSSFNEGFMERFAADSLKEGMASLTQSLYLHMVAKGDHENFVFSPLSIHSSLAMLYLGATHWSDTSEELARAIGITNNRNLLQLGYRGVVDTYANETNFLYGNNFWIQDGFEVKETFLKMVRDNMNSGVDRLDFSQTDSVAKVNKWIRQMTAGKIPNLVDSFPSDTTLFMANALYFKENWRIPFMNKDRLTGQRLQGNFRTARRGVLPVAMIEQKSNIIKYEEVHLAGQLTEVVTVPYENDLFEMQIFLPATNKGMYTLEQKMRISNDMDVPKNNHRFFNLFSEKNRSLPENFVDDVYLKMPTFKIKTDMDAVEPLQELGVEKVNVTYIK
jgi:serine protease inhibitor